ncbi:MAG: glycogen/starch synthase [Muribaculaceae bacterium]|nr:glycogen/starch synthase [Muribaculaceae bacterium]
MAKERILFITQEITPYISANPVSSLGKFLPVSMQDKGFEVRTFMPKFGAVNERRNQLHEVIRLSGININIDDNDHPLVIKVASLQPSRIQVYFIDNDDFFQKLESDIDVSGVNREDNDERAIFFSRGTMETAKKLRWDPKIIHCSGWITSLIPIYIKRLYGDDLSFKNSKIVYSIQPAKDMAPINPKIINKLKAEGISSRDLKKYASDTTDVNTLHKIGIDYAHGIIVNDPEIDPSLLDYIKESGKPLLMAPDMELDADKYLEFYNSLCN